MKWIRFVRGWVRLSVTGDFAERFYNLLIQQGLMPYDMHRTSDGQMELTLPRGQFRRIRYARRMTGVRIKILEKGGLPRTVWKYRRRWGLIVGAVLAAVFVFLMSGFIWSIRFEGEVADRDLLLAALQAERESSKRTHSLGVTPSICATFLKISGDFLSTPSSWAKITCSK